MTYLNPGDWHVIVFPGVIFVFTSFPCPFLFTPFILND